MLTSVSIKNFKCLRDVQTRVSPFTVICGSNASGKTSFLQAIEILCQSVGSRCSSVFTGDNSAALMRTHGASDDPEIRGEFTKRSTSEPHFLRVSINPKKHRKKKATIKSRLGPPAAQYIRFEYERLRSPSFTNFPEECLNPDGSNFASVLATIAATSPDKLQELYTRVQAVVPFFQRIRLDQAKRTVFEKRSTDPDGEMFYEVPKEQKGFELSIELESGGVVPASGISEGSLLTLALFTFIVSQKRPGILLLDNIDNGLHPKALKDLAGQLRKIQRQLPAMQIIASSHSPYLLDEFKPSEVLLFTLDADGFTVCRPIDEHPDFDRWKDEMFPGEFWSMVGEEWLLQKGATAVSKQS